MILYDLNAKVNKLQTQGMMPWCKWKNQILHPSQALRWCHENRNSPRWAAGGSCRRCCVPSPRGRAPLPGSPRSRRYQILWQLLLVDIGNPPKIPELSAGWSMIFCSEKCCWYIDIILIYIYYIYILINCCCIFSHFESPSWSHNKYNIAIHQWESRGYNSQKGSI